MAQEPNRPLHIPRFQQAADIGGGHGDPVQLLLRHHHAGKARFGAHRPQLIGIPLTPVAEPEIMAAHKARGAVSDQSVQKILPGCGHRFPIHAKRVDWADTVAAQKPLTILRGIDKPRRIFPKKCLRMPVKSDGRCLHVQFLSQTAALGKQRLMSQMHSVKKAQGKNSFVSVHTLTCSVCLRRYRIGRMATPHPFCPVKPQKSS